MKKLAIILAIIFVASPGYACGKWVLSGSKITGSRHGGRVINRCYYQDLEGSGEALSVEVPQHSECLIILDPCPEGGSGTEIIVNQDLPPVLDAVPRVLFKDVYKEYLRRRR